MYRRTRTWMVRGGIGLLVAGCAVWLMWTFSPAAVQPPAPMPLPEKKRMTEAEVWLTTGDQSQLLARQEPRSWKPVGPDDEKKRQNVASIRVNAGQAHQKMEGFGAAMTGSSVYLINSLPQEQREMLLHELFTAEGLNLNMVRHTIGASDYSVNASGEPSSYTYDDVEEGTDYALEHFSIEQDEGVVAMLEDVVRVKPDVKVMGTPWTAPAWMKYGERTHNGWYLNYNDPGVYAAYAAYFVKYIQAYQARGVPIHSITVQNEPEFTSPNYPSMSMGAAEQAMFIRDYLGPAFMEAGLDTRIIAYDHNWDQAVRYTEELFEDRRTAASVEGSAFHCYAGDPSAMTEVHDRHPDKMIYVTECSGGEWSPDFGTNLSWQMSNLIIGAARNWASSVLFWNIALDPQGGPTNGGCANCRGMVTIDPESGKVERNVEYYAMGHISRYVRSGAVRVETNQEPGVLENAAFRNPDGSMVLIASNSGQDAVAFEIVMDDNALRYTLPPQSAATFRWKEAGSAAR